MERRRRRKIKKTTNPGATLPVEMYTMQHIGLQWPLCTTSGWSQKFAAAALLLPTWGSPRVMLRDSFCYGSTLACSPNQKHPAAPTGPHPPSMQGHMSPQATTGATRWAVRAAQGSLLKSNLVLIQEVFWGPANLWSLLISSKTILNTTRRQGSAI